METDQQGQQVVITDVIRAGFNGDIFYTVAEKKGEKPFPEAVSAYDVRPPSALYLPGQTVTVFQNGNGNGK